MVTASSGPGTMTPEREMSDHAREKEEQPCVYHEEKF